MRAMRHVRTWCQPGQRGSLGLVCIVSLLLLGSHTPVVAQNAPLGKTQSAIGTLVVIRPDRIEDPCKGKGLSNCTRVMYCGQKLPVRP